MNNLSEVPNAAQPTVQEGRSLRFHIIAAIVVYVVDALFFGQGVITFFVAACFVSSVIFKTLFRLIKRQPIPKVGLIKAGIYCACLAAVISTIIINNKIAKNHAETVVLAIKQYKVKYSHYPDTLQSLVPEFLPSVPLAKYTFAFNGFMYRRFNSMPGGSNAKAESTPKESVIFLYTTLPPFGRPTYDFERDKWGYLD